jgi:beta-lactamase superfamily II metal-dependent hydrolase
VEFVVMSHPHYDHYSGLEQVLRYCEAQNVLVKRFLHTARHARAYLQTVVAPRECKNSLHDLLGTVHRLKEQGVIKTYGSVKNTTRSIDLTDDVRLTVLSPSEREYEEYVRTLYNEELDEKTSPDANCVATLLLIETNDWFALLTSDVRTETLRRVGIEEMRKETRKLKMGQVPHHGSEHGHYKEFWKRKDYDKGATPLALSVGVPNSHGHPSKQVLRDLSSLGYQIRATAGPLSAEEGAASDVRRILVNASTPATTPPSEGGDVEVRLCPTQSA